MSRRVAGDRCVAAGARLGSELFALDELLQLLLGEQQLKGRLLALLSVSADLSDVSKRIRTIILFELFRFRLLRIRYRQAVCSEHPEEGAKVFQSLVVHHQGVNLALDGVSDLLIRIPTPQSERELKESLFLRDLLAEDLLLAVALEESLDQVLKVSVDRSGQQRALELLDPLLVQGLFSLLLEVDERLHLLVQQLHL